MKMKLLLTSCGESVSVDDEDFERLKGFKWFMKPNGYAARSVYDPKTKKVKTVYLHVDIPKPERGKLTDHIDLNKKNNCRSNLRRCSYAQNAMNSGKIKTWRGKTLSSKYKGVSWNKASGHWQASITVNGKHLSLLYSKNEKDCAIAYMEASRKFFGSFSRSGLHSVD